VTTWLWIGTAGMSLGALAFLVLGRRSEGKEADFVLITFFIAFIAATAYLAMALGQGVVTIDGDEVFFARYIDWIITTPLLLLDLAILAGAGRRLTIWLLGLNVHMIATGLVAGLTVGNDRYIWFAVSTVSFIALLGLLVGRFLALAKTQGPEVAALFTRLAGLTAVLWSAYPVVWLLGTEGTGAISLTTEVAVFAVLDLSAKIGFGFLLLTKRAVVSTAKPAPRPTTGTVTA
jgi:bacteriorhodopsin